MSLGSEYFMLAKGQTVSRTKQQKAAGPPEYRAEQEEDPLVSGLEQTSQAVAKITCDGIICGSRNCTAN